MKNADDMLKQIVREVDSSGDGKIQYEGIPTLTKILIVHLATAPTGAKWITDMTFCLFRVPNLRRKGRASIVRPFYRY